MSGFLDHLFDPKASGKSGRERLRYRETLRTLIQDAPAVRRLPVFDFPFLVTASSASEQKFPTSELSYALIGEQARSESFRVWKQAQALPIYRLDPIESEEQVLETRGMGADAFTLEVGSHDLAMLQFLLEVGRDYGLPAVLSCRTPDDLALALKVQDGGMIWLRAELQNLNLLDLTLLKERIVLIESETEIELNSEWVCGVIRIGETLALQPLKEKTKTKNLSDDKGEELDHSLISPAHEDEE